MAPKPSKLLPPPSHGLEDDTRSLISVPSLTGSGSTADSVSILGESPTRRIAPIACRRCRRMRVKCFHDETPPCKACKEAGVSEECIFPSPSDLGKDRAFRHPSQYAIEPSNGFSSNSELFQTLESISRPELIRSHYDDGSDGMMGRFLSQQDYVPRYTSIKERIRDLEDTKIGRGLLRLADQSTLFTGSGPETRQENMLNYDTLALGVDFAAAMELRGVFMVTIVVPGRDIGDDLECYASAAWNGGDVSYISRQFLRIYNIDQEDGQIHITWRKANGSKFTPTWCTVLEKDKIEGNIDLCLAGSHDIASFVSEVESASPERSRDIENSSDGMTDVADSLASMSDESSVTTRGPIEIRREQIIGKITLVVIQWLRSQFIRARTAAHEATRGFCEGGSAPSGTSAQHPKDPAQPKGKRKVADRGADADQSDDEETIIPPHPGANDRKGKGKEIVRFACPYFKYNPTKYQQWPSCPGPGWLDVHRVKEHLYRKHRQPRFRCVRCWECFDSEQSYIDHQRALLPCELGEKELVEGFDADQERQLRSRKKSRHIISETDKWIAVYKILFPHVLPDDIPSPFYEYETHTRGALTECEEYVLREIPLRLREILVPEFDRDFQIIEQSLQRRAIESTRTIVASLFQEFRTLHQRGVVPATALTLAEPQDHASSISSLIQPSWLDSMESNEIFLDHTGFGLDFSVLGDVQLQDIPEAPTDPENSALKQSDSGYESMNAGQPE